MRAEARFAIERSQQNTYFLTEATPPHSSEPSVHLQVQFAGLCGTDIQIMRGIRTESARILGHEALCSVVGIDPGIDTDLRLGDLAVVNPTARNDPSFLLGHNVPGVFQSHLSLPKHVVENGQIVGLPPSTTGALSVLIEPLACALYSISMTARFDVSRFVVFGDGIVGSLTRKMLLKSGVDGRNIMVISRAQFAVMASTETIPDGFAEPCAITVATPRDSTRDCLDFALLHAAAGSVIDIIGGLDPPNEGPVRQMERTRAANVAGGPQPPEIYRHERLGPVGPSGAVSVTGHRGVSREHLLEAARIIQDCPDDFTSLLTHIVEPSVAVEVFNNLAETGSRIHDGKRIMKLAVQISTMERGLT